jgi:hypothetical protein
LAAVPPVQVSVHQEKEDGGVRLPQVLLPHLQHRASSRRAARLAPLGAQSGRRQAMRVPHPPAPGSG